MRNFKDRQVISEIRDIIKYTLEEFSVKQSGSKVSESVMSHYLEIPIHDFELCFEFFKKLDSYINILIGKGFVSRVRFINIEFTDVVEDWYVELYDVDDILLCKLTFFEQEDSLDIVEDSKELDSILEGMYEAIKNSIPSDMYSFKGGFILKKYIEESNLGYTVRRTQDLDMSVVDIDSFNLVVSSVLEYLSKLEEAGYIEKPRVREPVYSDTKRRSGSISIVKKGEKREFCGIDISYHLLDYGLVTVSDGSTRFTYERMMADKLAVMFSDEYTVARRIRDVLDIYLISMLHKLDTGNEVLFNDDLLYCLKERMDIGGIKSESVFEKMFKNDIEYLLFKFDTLVSNRKVGGEFFKSYDSVKILEWVVRYIGYIRSKC